MSERKQARLNKHGELRQYLADCMLAVRDGDMAVEKASVTMKLSREITENYYAELKMHKLCLEMGAQPPQLGDAPIGRAGIDDRPGD
jgi:hypothetical protein